MRASAHDAPAPLAALSASMSSSLIGSSSNELTPRGYSGGAVSAPASSGRSTAPAAAIAAAEPVCLRKSRLDVISLTRDGDEAARAATTPVESVCVIRRGATEFARERVWIVY